MSDRNSSDDRGHPRTPGESSVRMTKRYALAIAIVFFAGVTTWISTAIRYVNKVAAHGGAINTSGAVVVRGMVFVGSGYAIGSGASGGNVLLAFGVE